MVIVDASVLVNALVHDGETGKRARSALAEDDAWAAPEHMPMEAFSAIRELGLGGRIEQGRAQEAVTTLAEEIEIELIGVRRFFGLMWQMRGHVSGYDAAYAVAAEVTDCPVLTSDLRLAKAITDRCRVVVV